MLEFRGYEVEVAERAEKMTQILSDKEVHLVIMDMLLSGDDGTDICSRMKHDPATEKLPVLMFSAHPNAKELCLASGADEFIAKPFDIQDLYKKVDSLISA
jgi:DNA-binding response OmpR family regulator